MFGAPVALAFTAGMVATFDPSGFSLLPAYISSFVVGDEATDRMDRRIIRAIGAAGSMSVGFVLVFTTVGLAIESLAGQVRRQLPWVTVVIGVLLIAAGVAMVAGWKPTAAVPMLNLKRRGGRHRVMVIDGSTFAVVSLSCTIGPFLAVTGAALTQSSVQGFAAYVAYALGMGVMILAISLASALAHTTAVNRMRRISAGVSRLGGALMILAGGYVIWYASWELAVFRGDPETDPLIDAAEGVRLWFVEGIGNIGSGRPSVIVGVLVVAGIWAARTRTAHPPLGEDHKVDVR